MSRVLICHERTRADASPKGCCRARGLRLCRGGPQARHASLHGRRDPRQKDASREAVRRARVLDFLAATQQPRTNSRIPGRPSRRCQPRLGGGSTRVKRSFFGAELGLAWRR